MRDSESRAAEEPQAKPRRRGDQHHSTPGEHRASVDEPEQAEVDVGGCLRRLREARNLSIRALAEQSGLAVNTLSLIEHGKTSPSVSTLQQLATALRVPITAFFERDSAKKEVVYTRTGSSARIGFTHGTLEDLGAGLSERAVEPFLVTLEPNASCGPHPIVHTGQEFVYCLEGRIAYIVEEQTYVLEPGDSLLFFAYLPHRWYNVATGMSKALLVLCPADSRDRPDELHFASRSRLPQSE